MFPQFSESTTMAQSMPGKELGNRVNMPSFEFVSNFHRAKCFIDHSVRFIENDLQRLKDEGKPADDLIISFHGLLKEESLKKMISIINTALKPINSSNNESKESTLKIFTNVFKVASETMNGLLPIQKSMQLTSQKWLEVHCCLLPKLLN